MRGHQSFQKQTILGVSLIHGQFRALAVIRGEIAGTWECPQKVTTGSELRWALQEAVRATGFSGHRVGFVVEDARLAHQYHLVPPMKDKDLRLYLERVARQELPPDVGDIVWRYRKTLATKGRTGFLLDTWPQAYVDDFLQACEAVDLHPAFLFPLSAVFVDQVRSLGAEPQETLILITPAVEKFVLIAATGEGVPLFDRFLRVADESGPQNLERIGRELARSILFANQQLGKRVSHVWMMGTIEGVLPEELRAYVDVPVLPSPIVPDPSYWIWVSLSLPVTHSCNFISPEVRQAPFRKMMAKVMVAMLAGFICTSVTVSGLIEGLADRKQAIETAVAASFQVLAQKKHDWLVRHQQLAEMRAWVQAVETRQRPPVAGWFMGYLAESLPQDLVLQKVMVTQTTDGWTIELTGLAPDDLQRSARALMEFERRLREGPYHVEMTNGWRQAWLEQLRHGKTDEQDGRHFVLRGFIR
ncbi:MAG: hypothetical protein D6704_04225 [Nitrospirae bacterium]|nr:MAG: hypothetical protein D6704_04225 [Nitrospirota bacterium]